MAKYGPLHDWLVRQRGNLVAASFVDLDELVGGLPRLARRYPGWWENHRAYPQAQAWLDAGFRVEAVDIGSGRVVFGRHA